MRYFILILILISIIISFFYKQAIFDHDKFSKKYNIILNIKNDYKNYFFLKNSDPIYVFKNNLLEQYSVYAHNNNKSNLIYPNQQTIADINYIKNIQYIGSIREPFKAKFLYNGLDNITNLSPYWTYIYNFWQILLPASKYYEDDIDKKLTWENAVKFWEKWILFNCDEKKIKNILLLKDDKYMEIAYNKTWIFYQKNKNPCSDDKIADNLWFNYFQYIRNLENAVKYYKVAWFDENTLFWTIWMVWVINWILWEHEKAMYILTQKVINIYNIISKNKELNDKEIKKYNEQIENTIKRAQEELNFYIIDQAEKKLKDCQQNYDCLVKNWYIKQTIQDLYNECSKNTALKSIKTIEDIIKSDIKQSLENTKCFLLQISIINKYIDLENWKLKSAIIEWWTYYYDTTRWTWWVWLRK